MDKALPGIVTSIDGRRSEVRLQGTGATLRCGLRTALRGGGAGRIAVGDRVDVRRGDDGEGTIDAVHPRQTRLARGRGREEQVIAANVDQIAVVAAAAEPAWRPGFVDRVICAAEKGGLEPLLLANKVDLVAPGSEREAAIRRDLETWRALGYRTIEASARTGAGIDALRDALRGRVTVFAGQSGVGKSSLLNAVSPGLELATREVSRGTRKGRHTTTRVSLLPLADAAGYVLDTPGVRAFSFYDLEPREVAPLFRDVARIAASCRFRDCLHVVEPECAVRYAAESGALDPRRYESYQRILASLDEDEAAEEGEA
jgi:ribosome biogenesis GTPase